MSNDPDQIRADIDRQREQLAETVDALHGQIEQSAKAAVKPAVIGVGVLVVGLVGFLVWRRTRR